MTKRRFAAAVLTLILLPASVSSAFAWEIETPDATPEMYEKPENRNIPMPEGISRIYLDLPYCGENSTKTEKLHLLLPEDGEGPYPVLISVHGGGLEANIPPEIMRCPLRKKLLSLVFSMVMLLPVWTTH